MNRALEKETADSMASGTAEVSETVRQKLASALKDEPELSGMVDRIWSFGPRKCGPNVLINNIPGKDVFLSLLVLCCRSLLIELAGTTAAAQIGRPRQAVAEKQEDTRV